MPFLRVIRDKRGYETTYLMHWYREGQRQRTKVLYVFRTPGGVRVGRNVLEPDVLRQIEIQHPDIQFDWAAVRENKQIVDTAPEPRRRAKRPEGENGAKPIAPAAASVARAPAAQPPKPAIPSELEGATPDEQIAFLTVWYPLVRDRIPQRSAEPARQEALLALAERLNPAAWTDADQITSGLQQAAEALERLSHVFAKRRRRGRKRPGEGPRPAPEAAAETPSPSDSEPPPAES